MGEMRKGDRVLIEVEAVAPGDGNSDWLVEFSDGDQEWVSGGVLLAGKRLPREIAVGDRVRWRPAGVEGVVLVIDGKVAGVRTNTGAYYWPSLRDLTPADDTAQEVG